MPIYGGSVGQVAQNEIQMGAQQRAAMERQLMMLLEQHNRSKQNAMQERQMSRADANDAEQRRQFDASLAADKAKADATLFEREGEFDLTEDYRRDALRESRRASRQQMYLNSRLRREVAAERESKMFLPNAEAAADEGAWGSMEEFQATNPPNMFPYAPALVSRSLRARKILGEQHAADQAEADLVNRGPSRVAALRNMIKQEGDDSWNPDLNHFYYDSPDKDAINEWTNEAAGIEGSRNAVLADKNRMSRLTPNQSGRYAPVGTLPWMNRVPVKVGASTQVDGPTATNPKTGERIIFRDGKWQPLR